MNSYDSILDEKHERLFQLQQETSIPNQLSAVNTRTSILSGLVLFSIGLLVCTALLRGQQQYEPGKNILSLDANPASNSFGFQLSNEYPPLESLETYPWEYLAEPYRITKLKVKSPLADVMYKWSITSDVTGLPIEVTSDDEDNSEVSATFTHAGSFYTVKIEEIGGLNRRFETKVICKYVRREVRDLTENDRQTLMYALKIFHTISQEEGKERYGERFFTRKELTILHVEDDGGGCSPWHGSQGTFIYSHLAMTLWIEQALQLIDPTIAMPYWNYIKDSVEYGSKFHELSPIFTDEYFGAYQPYPHDLKGLWADTPLSTIQSEEDCGSMHNSYNIITAYDNNNPSKMLQRSSEICGWHLELDMLPGCSAIHSALRSFSLKSAWESIFDEVHTGYIHQTVGGAWDCAEDYSELMADYSNDPNGVRAKALLETFLLETDDLWTWAYSTNIMADPGTCSVDIPFEDCRWKCAEAGMDEADDLTDEQVYDYLKAFEFLDFFSDDLITDSATGMDTFRGVDSETDAKLKRNLLKLGCNPGKMSQYFSLGATDDPLFFPIHSYFEIYWSYLLLTKPNFSLEWSTDSTCYGHHLTDSLPFQWYGFLGEEQNEDGTLQYTNEDLVRIFDPANVMSPYVVDSFNWDFCYTDDLSDQHVKPVMHKED